MTHRVNTQRSLKLLFQLFVYSCNINMKYEYIQCNIDGLEYGQLLQIINIDIWSDNGFGKNR